MKKFVLECCVDRLESARNAVAAGADRLELCANLVIGGTTPSLTLFRQIKREMKIRTHVLIRPRFGDFCYTDAEVEEMEEAIRMFRAEGADGVVIGALGEGGDLNTAVMERLIKEADGMSVTLHRAFDLCKDPFRTLDEAIELGVDTILTSGQAKSAWEGRDLLQRLIHYGKNRIDLMAGGGVNGKTIEKLQPYTGGTSFHMSGKETLDSPMQYRKSGVNMGLDGLSEYEIWQTSEEKVREAVQILEKLQKKQKGRMNERN